MSHEHVLVTGAGGYIGRHVVTALLDGGYEVTAIVRNRSRSAVDERAQLVQADVLDPALDVTTLTDQQPAAVVHLAWQDGFAHNAPSHMMLLSAHYAFLSKIVDWGVGRLSVLGTMHEVGYWEGAIDAETPTNPLSLYGIAKDALRKAAFTSLADKTSLTWLRCYYIYGDDRNNNSIFTRLLEAHDHGRTTFPFTSGKNKYDFIKVEELGRQIATVVSTPDLQGIINCGTGTGVSLADTVESFIQENDLGISLEYGKFPDRPYDSPGVWGDATLIRSLMTD